MTVNNMAFYAIINVKKCQQLLAVEHKKVLHPRGQYFYIFKPFPVNHTFWLQRRLL